METAGAATIPMTPINTPPSAPVLTAATTETINGNIKEMKTRVLDFNKAKVIFDAREKGSHCSCLQETRALSSTSQVGLTDILFLSSSEINRLNQELGKAHKTIETLQNQTSNNSPSRREYDEMRMLLTARAQETEEARVDSKLVKLKQKDAEERLVKQSQKLKATEMLRLQLEAKMIDQDKLLGQLKDLQKKLDTSSRRR